MRATANRHSQHGFTLLEIAIVLSILALAMGGIFVGANMIHAAKIRSVVSESESYVQAIRGFKDRYNAYPGDMPQATRLWDALHATHANCITIAAAIGQTATCNGNGDGHIGGIGTGSYDTNTDQVYEMFRVWQHLANAELIPDFYTGIAHSSTAVDDYASAPLRPAESAAVYGQNAPRSSFRGDTGWNISSAWGLYNSCNDSSGKNINGLALVFASLADGQLFNIGLTDGAENLLSPQEAETLDAKVDDALPSSGNFQAVGSECPVDCTANAAYDIANEKAVCGIMYLNQF